MKPLLDKLTLKAINSGVCSGHNRWITGAAAPITSDNPTTGAAIAQVIPADAAAYDTIVADAQTAFRQWRSVPAPKRGEVIRDLGALLREYREPLGELVSLETGKIRAEGVGEVQEMIDICDFAVGLSRQLYGLTMHTACTSSGTRSDLSGSSPPLTSRLQSGRGTPRLRRSAAIQWSGNQASWRRSAGSQCSTLPIASWPTMG